MATIEKVIKETTVKCDFCEATEEFDTIFKCDVCNKDVCRTHRFYINHTDYMSSVWTVCVECMAKLGLVLETEEEIEQEE
jgi:hypothetical protein